MKTVAELQATKMEVAKEVVTGILDLLRPDDRVSIAMFTDYACVPLQLTLVECLDINQVKEDFNVSL